MTSTLIITSVEKIQKEINKIINSNSDTPGIYVSLNKTQESVTQLLNKDKINTSKLFFIDLVATENSNENVVYIKPNNLSDLSYAIKTFIKRITNEKYLIIDSISTLLIYNTENKVADFVKKITSYASANNVKVFALSPKTKGEELLEKIFNFFDDVKK